MSTTGIADRWLFQAVQKKLATIAQPIRHFEKLQKKLAYPPTV
ncbi:UNVERIFIED_CONTAM: hypothetical protein GTU68_062274 [Idotea baltica]|nr:hypothetical protein [Idotea baltica]